MPSDVMPGMDAGGVLANAALTPDMAQAVPSAVHLAMQQQQVQQQQQQQAAANEAFAAASFVTPLKYMCIDVVAKEFRNRATFGRLH